MKIVHVDLGAYTYVHSWGYQENYMIKAHHVLGHDVTEITSSYVPKIYKEYIDKNEDFLAQEKIEDDGTKIIRLKYKLKLPFSINSRLRLYDGLYDILVNEAPDVIFVHDLQFLSVFSIKKYINEHPKCIAKADFHSQYENSASTLISKYILHKVFYRYIVRHSFKAFQKIYYIDEGNMVFLDELYGIKKDDWKFEFLPLGGFITEAEEKLKIRNKVRMHYNISEDAVVILHSGKLEKEKRTLDLIHAFKRVSNDNLLLVIIGAIPVEQEQLLKAEIESDSRIVFLGWKSADELRDFLCTCDVYAQPGSPSSTFETALCVGCPVIVNMRSEVGGGGYTSYIHNEMVLPVSSVEDITAAIEKACNKDIVSRLSSMSLEYAKKELDYVKIVQKIVNDDRETK